MPATGSCVDPTAQAAAQTAIEHCGRVLNGGAPGAAALVRHALRKLGQHLRKLGDNVNADIDNQATKGRPIPIQHALDIVRVTGNSAVHPAEMQLEQEPKPVALVVQPVNLGAEKTDFATQSRAGTL